MTTPPKWYLPTAIVALLWNLLGCAGYLADVTLTPDDIAAMSPADQALYASRPAWAVAATAVAVWAGAVGSIGLIVRRRWATPVLMASLLGVVMQDIALFMPTEAGSQPGATVVVLQSLVLMIAIGLVILGRKAAARGWLT